MTSTDNLDVSPEDVQEVTGDKLRLTSEGPRNSELTENDREKLDKGVINVSCINDVGDFVCDLQSIMRENSRKINNSNITTGTHLDLDGPSRSDPNSSFTNGSAIAFPEENITYTWSAINVFTSGVEEQGFKLVNGIKRVFCPSRQNRIQSRKHILKNVTGVAYPGELLAIMGSSGAGKTALLNTLTFRNRSNGIVSGQRAVNGIPINSSTLASLSAYVQQDDLFIGTLTVREHLIFQALVRMDRHIPVDQRMQRVAEVLADLGLAKCENTVIGTPGRIKGISGGEMKRLSFASEVLTNPPVMFCDEPTSGLDSYMAHNVVTVLKNMANKMKTIICTIHQPSSEVYAMFDKILLMAEGRVAFLGSRAQANHFFSSLGAACPSNYNPADHYIQLLAVVPSKEETCRNTIEMVCDTFDRSDFGIRLAQATEPRGDVQAKTILCGKMDIFSNGNVANRSPYKAAWSTQFKAVLWRSWLSVKKDPTLMKLRLVQALMVSIMIGLIYFGQILDQDGVMNINGALFTCLTNMTFQNIFAVITVFCSEIPLFVREHQNGMYRVDVYFLCKTLAEVPIFLAVPIIFTSVMYYMVQLNPLFPRFLTATLIITLVSTVATSFGYLISCVSSSVSMALFIGPPVIIPFLLFGGFFLNAGSVPYYFKSLSYLSWFKYGNEALLINQWSGIDDIACTQVNTTCPKNGQVLLETLNFSADHYALDFLFLVLLIIGFRLLAFLALLWRTASSSS